MLVLLILTIVLVFTGCGSNGEQKLSMEELDQITEEANSDKIEKEEKPKAGSGDDTKISTETTDEETEKKNEEDATDVKEEPVIEEGTRSKLTGEIISDEIVNRRPFVVMLDNQYSARPQASLSDADIVYELLAEGKITRYMAVIQSKEPESVGPIRSARPYFIDKAIEYDPIYVHVGGSEQAKKDIRSLKMAEVDGLSCSAKAMWRTKHKKIPHNMYSSYDALTYEANRKNYRTEAEFKGFNFDLAGYVPEGSSAVNVKIPYKAPTSRDKVGYTSEFRYDETSGQYLRYVNNDAYKDEKTKIHLSASNVIIQRANHKVIDNEGRLKVDLVGKGSGFFLTKGKSMPITWEKSSRRAATVYYDSEGNEIVLNVGVTWIQVIPADMKLTVK